MLDPTDLDGFLSNLLPSNSNSNSNSNHFPSSSSTTATTPTPTHTHTHTHTTSSNQNQNQNQNQPHSQNYLLNSFNSQDLLLNQINLCSPQATPSAPQLNTESAIKIALDALQPDTKHALLALLLASQPPSLHQLSPPNHFNSDHSFQFSFSNQLLHSSNLHPLPSFNPPPKPIHSAPPSSFHASQPWHPPNFLSLSHQLPQEPSSPRLPAIPRPAPGPTPGPGPGPGPGHGTFLPPRDPVSHQITPVLSPIMTPLSTFSAGSYSTSCLSDSQCPAPAPYACPSELFSPLTSPALRPEARNEPDTRPATGMPTLIDQAAALGLSAHPPRAPQTYLPSPVSPLFSPLTALSGPPNPSNLPNSPADAHTLASHIAPPNPVSSTPTSPLVAKPAAARHRPPRPPKSRPSPHLRTVDEATPEGGPAKRARSATGSASPAVAGVRAPVMGDSPSPVDLCGMDVDATRPRLGLMAPPETPASAAMSSSTGTQAVRRIQPMTPASIMGLESVSAGKNAKRALPSDKEPAREEICERGRPQSEAVRLDTTGNGMGMGKDKENDKEKEKEKEKDNGHGTETGDCQSRSRSGERSSLSEATRRSGSTDSQRKRSGSGKRAQEGPEIRKSSHKVAEQRRRDSLKMCFEDLRQILPPIQWTEADGVEKRPGEGNVGGQRSLQTYDPTQPNRGISKVALLRRSNEYIEKLRERLKRRDGAIERLVGVIEEMEDGRGRWKEVERVLERLKEDEKEDEREDSLQIQGSSSRRAMGGSGDEQE